MTEMPVPGFETGGFSWFHDLTVADPTGALPVVSALSMVLALRVRFSLV
jgi:YidC/Oxa1 family membrane protein insertase